MRPLPERTPAAGKADGASAGAGAVADLAFARRVEDWLDGLACTEDEQALRRQLFHQAVAAGLPDARTEAWRYADLKGLSIAAFFPTLAAVSEEGGEDAAPWPRLCFRNGHCGAGGQAEGADMGAWSFDHGCPPDLPGPDLLASDDSVWQLARVFATHGARVNVARGQERRLELTTTAYARPVHGLHDITIARDATLTLLIRIRGGVTAASERLLLRLEDGARARILLLQDTTAGGHHFLRVDAEIGAGAALVLMQAVAGTGHARAEHHWHFIGSASRGELALLGLPHGGGCADVLTRFRHADQDTQSRQTVRMLAAYRDRAAYQGLVHVAHGADGTDSRQDAKGLLLARGGEIDLKPELEIFADDVACAHGATVGQLDPLALFYLTARGIPEAEARRMLIAAFADGVMDVWPGEDAFSPALGEMVVPALAALSTMDEGEAA